MLFLFYLGSNSYGEALKEERLDRGLTYPAESTYALRLVVPSTSYEEGQGGLQRTYSEGITYFPRPHLIMC